MKELELEQQVEQILQDAAKQIRRLCLPACVSRHITKNYRGMAEHEYTIRVEVMNSDTNRNNTD